MRHGREWFVTSALAIVVMAGCLTACTDSVPEAMADPPLSIKVSLATTFATSNAAIVVVAMGRIGDPLNTFWELFSRPDGTSQWTLVTPPGVADNGGLVISPNPGSHNGNLLLTGFEPSQLLAFSPLALSKNGGESWSPGLVPGGLAAVPDALAASSGGERLALVRAGGGEIFRSRGSLSDWSELGGRHVLVTSAAGRSCGVGRLTAVAVDDTGRSLVGTGCAVEGVVGIFSSTGGVWRQEGPKLSGTSASGATEVLRLVEVDGVTGALVAARAASKTILVGVTKATGRPWSQSKPLALARGSRIVSTGVEPGGGFVVLTSRSNGRQAIERETGPGGSWRSLPSPPSGTAAVVVSGDGAVDALSESLVQLTDWRLDEAAGTWNKTETVTVPIQFGSSS